MSDRLIEFEHGPWYLQCLPDDGARISVLRYDGIDLLTAAPAEFRAPKADYGEYELRPVYAYDDCFPSIRPCEHPQLADVLIRDHGDICYLSWEVEASGDRLDCSVRSETTPAVSFRRSLVFDGDSLQWRFEAANESDRDYAFIHVMHPLMPPEKIKSIKLPDFGRAVSPMQGGVVLAAKTGAEQAEYLLSRPSGSADFMLLLNVASGEVELGWEGDITLSIEFDTEIFETLGIWWNRRGYPPEKGIERSECAFEPVPGVSASLEKCVADGKYMTIPPAAGIAWNFTWRIRRR